MTFSYSHERSVKTKEQLRATMRADVDDLKKRHNIKDNEKSIEDVENWELSKDIRDHAADIINEVNQD